MANRWTNDLTADDVTPKQAFLNRRHILAGGAGLGALAATGARAQDALEPNTLEEITTYNNFYEFGTGKSDPANNAHALQIDPWTITVDGMVDNPGEYSLAEVLDGMTIEDRLYRFRCVEAWSMVIPWNGFELADLLNRVVVQDGASHVAFQTVVQPDNMIGVRRGVLEFPYMEGLRLDEAASADHHGDRHLR